MFEGKTDYAAWSGDALDDPDDLVDAVAVPTRQLDEFTRFC
jgi:hypothetical protein